MDEELIHEQTEPTGDPVNIEYAREMRAAELAQELGEAEAPPPQGEQGIRLSISMDELFTMYGAERVRALKLEQIVGQIQQQLSATQIELHNCRGHVRNLTAKGGGTLGERTTK